MKDPSFFPNCYVVHAHIYIYIYMSPLPSPGNKKNTPIALFLGIPPPWNTSGNVCLPTLIVLFADIQFWVSTMQQAPNQFFNETIPKWHHFISKGYLQILLRLVKYARNGNPWGTGVRKGRKEGCRLPRNIMSNLWGYHPFYATNDPLAPPYHGKCDWRAIAFIGNNFIRTNR